MRLEGRVAEFASRCLPLLCPARLSSFPCTALSRQKPLSPRGAARPAAPPSAAVRGERLFGGVFSGRPWRSDLGALRPFSKRSASREDLPSSERPASAEADPSPPPTWLRRVLIVSKQTKFEAALAEKLAQWRRQHRPRRREDGGEGEELYTPGTPAFEAAAAAAERKAAAELALDFPEAHRSHCLHSRIARQVRAQLREVYGLQVTEVKARTLHGRVIDVLGAALPPDAVFSAGEKKRRRVCLASQKEGCGLQPRR